MQQFLCPRSLPGGVSFAIALLRVLAGVALVMHSFPKLDNPTGWMPGDAFPGWALAFAAYGELIGGTLLALGLVTPIAALLVAGVMGGAVYHHIQKGDGFVGGYELALCYGLIAVAVLVSGPGKLSADALLFAKSSKS